MERLTVDSNFPEKNNSQILIYQTEGGNAWCQIVNYKFLKYDFSVCKTNS